MALIDVIKKAQSLGPADGQHAGIFSLEPFWLSVNEPPVSNGTLVRWRCVPPDDSIKLRIANEEALSAALDKLADDNPSTSAIHDLLRPYLDQVLEFSTGQDPSTNKSEKVPTTLGKLLKLASPGVGQKLLSSIVRTCLAGRYWDFVKIMLEARVIHGNTRPELVSVLIEHEQTFLLCVWISYVPDPMFSDILLVLKYFLKNAMRSGKSLAAVRCFWRESTLKAISKLVKKSRGKKTTGKMCSDVKNAAKIKSNKVKMVSTNEELIERAVLLSLAVDHFQPFELCLHSLLAFGHDEGVLTSTLSQLDGSEVIRLLRYLRKWLEKYSKQGFLYRSRINRRDLWVPSLPDILRWVSVLLDMHLSSLVFWPDVHGELQTIQRLVKDMVGFSHRCQPLAGILEQLQITKNVPRQIAGDHIIEYLEI